MKISCIKNKNLEYKEEMNNILKISDLELLFVK